MQFNLNLPFWSLNGKHEVKSPFLTMTVYLQGCLLPMNQLPNSIPCSLSFIMTRKIQHLISLIIRIPVLTFRARDIRVTQGVELLWMQWSQFKERLPMDQTSKLSSLCWHAFILWCQKLKVLSFVMLSSLLLGAPIGMRIRHYSCLLSHPTSNVRGLPFSTYAPRGRGVSDIWPTFAYDSTDRLREMRTREREGV